MSRSSPSVWPERGGGAAPATGWARRAYRASRATIVVALAVVVLMLPVGSGPPASHLAPSSVALPPNLASSATSPSVHAFSNGSAKGTQATTGPMDVLAADAFLVFVAVRGSSDVGSVTDTASDTFTEIAYQSRTDNTSHEGLSIWMAANVAGGSQVSVTASSSATLRIVLLAIDVTGVSATAPLDNRSAYFEGTNATVQAQVPASPNDLALFGVAAEGGSSVVASGGDSLVEQLTYPVAPRDTGAVLGESAYANGPMSMNATLSPALPWIAAGLSLRPASTDPTHKIWDVVVIYLENSDVQDVNRAGGTTYLKYLSSKYVNATRFFGVCHPSAPNYLAVIDGNAQQCGSDSVHLGLYTNTTLPDLLQNRGFTWGGYFESMPTPCDGSNSGAYVARHNPFLYFHDIWSNSSRCRSHVVNSAAFNASVSTNHTLPANFSLYVPNVMDDGHNTSVGNASHWLKTFLSRMLNTSDSRFRQVVNHTLFMVTFDESDNTKAAPGAQGDGSTGNLTSFDGAGYNGTYGGNVWFGFVNRGGFVVHGHFNVNSTQYRILSTIEWLFHLGNTGGVDVGSEFPAMTKLFTFSSNGY